jgi:hypothetical protein
MSCRGDPNVLSDFNSGSVYQSLQLADPRDIFMGVAFDGFQPFEDDAKYSMWPVVLTPYNFDSRVR